MSRRGSVQRGDDLRRVDAHEVMRVIVYITDHAGITSLDLADHLNVSDRTARRIIKYARDQLGVIITWRRDHTMPSHGEYSVESWGVFDSRAVRRFVRKLKQ